MKVLIAAIPMPGHINPLLSIGRILIAAGHEVTVASGSIFEIALKRLAQHSICFIRRWTSMTGAASLQRFPNSRPFLRARNWSDFISSASSSIKFRYSSKACGRFCGISRPMSSSPAVYSLASCQCCLGRGQNARPLSRVEPTLCFGAATTERQALPGCPRNHRSAAPGIRRTIRRTSRGFYKARRRLFE